MKLAGVGLLLAFTSTAFSRSEATNFAQLAEQIESERHTCICQEAARGLGKLGKVKRSQVYGAEDRVTCSIPSQARSDEGEVRYTECSQFIFVPGH